MARTGRRGRLGRIGGRRIRSGGLGRGLDGKDGVEEKAVDFEEGGHARGFEG